MELFLHMVKLAAENRLPCRDELPSIFFREAWTVDGSSGNRGTNSRVTHKGHSITTRAYSKVLSTYFRIYFCCRKYKISCSCIIFGNL